MRPQPVQHIYNWKHQEPKPKNNFHDPLYSGYEKPKRNPICNFYEQHKTLAKITNNFDNNDHQRQLYELHDQNVPSDSDED